MSTDLPSNQPGFALLSIACLMTMRWTEKFSIESLLDS
jgi:hypothetical protein